MVAIADLNLIGAVGIRVKPEARGFKRDAKAQVMAAMRGVDGEVPLTPRLEDGNPSIKLQAERLAKASGATVKLKTELDDKFSTRELERNLKDLERSAKIHLKVDDNLDALKANASDLVDRYRDARAELKALGETNLQKLTRSQNDLAKLADAQAKANERLMRQQGRLFDLETEIYQSRGKASQDLLDAYRDQEAVVADLRQTYSRTLNEVRDKEAEHLRLQEELNRGEAEAARRLDVTRRKAADTARSYREMKDTVERLYNDEQVYFRLVSSNREQVIELLDEQKQAGESYADTLDRILQTQGKLNRAEFADLRDWAKEDFRQSSVTHLRVEADTAVAEAQLQALERDRMVRINARVDRAILDLFDKMKGAKLAPGAVKELQTWTSAMNGMVKSASGFGTISKMNNVLKTSMKNMDSLAISSSILNTAIGTLSSVAVSATGGLATLATGLGAIAKGAVVLPATFLGLGTAFFTAKRALEDFIGAARGDEKAMERLAESSDLAATQAGKLFNTFKDADERGKSKFFANMEDQLGSLNSSMQPMAKLWEKSYDASGKFFRGILKGVNDWHDSGDMAPSLERIGDALDITSKSGEHFSNILTDLVDFGSTKLPGMASAFVDATGRLRDFLREAKNNGQMDVWFQEAKLQAEGLVNTLTGSIGVIRAVGKAAEQAGYGGFVSLGKMMEDTARKLETPLWQTGMTNLFKGAKDGAKEAGAGFQDLGDSIMEASKPLGDIMRTSGTVTGELGRMTGAALTNSDALGGVAEMMNDVRDAVDGSDKLFIYLGDAMGQGSRVAGELFKAFMQVAESVAKFWASGEELTKGLEQAIPVLADFASNVVELTHSLAGPLLDGIGYLLQGFSNLPGPAQQAALAIGAVAGGMMILRKRTEGNLFGAVAKQIPGFTGAMNTAKRSVSDFSTSWVLARDNVAKNSTFRQATGQLKDFGGVMSRLGGYTQVAASKIGSGFKQMGSEASGVRGHFDNVVAGAKNIGSGAAIGGIGVMKGALGGLKGAFTGITNALGGPWMVAIMAAIGALSSISQKMGETEGYADGLRGTLTAMGDSTEATIKQMSSNFGEFGGMMDKFEASAQSGAHSLNATTEAFGPLGNAVKYSKSLLGGWWEELTTGGKAADSFGEALDAAGLNTSQLANEIANGQGEYGKYGKAIQEANNIIQENGHLTEEQAVALFGTKDAMNITKQGAQELYNAYEQQRTALEMARKEQQEYAEATGLTGNKAQELKGAMQTVNDEMASSADKAQAVASAIDILNGSMDELAGTTSNYYESMDALPGVFAEVGEAVANGADVFGTWTDAAGRTREGINLTSDAGRKLDGQLRQSYDSAVQMAQQAYDSADSHAEGIKQANSVLGDFRESVRTQLQNMGLDAKTVDSILDQITGDPYEAQISIQGDAEVLQKARNVTGELKDKYDDQKFMAYLAANPDLAEEDIGKVIEKLAEVDSTEAAAKLGADDYASGKVSEAKKSVSDFDGKEGKGKLDVDNQVPKAVNEGNSALGKFDGKKATGELDADSSKAESKVGDIVGRVKEWAQGQYEAAVSARVERMEQVDNLIQKAKDWVLGSWSNSVTALTDGADKVGDLIQKGRDWIGGAWSNTVSATVDGANKVGDLIQKARDWVGGVWNNTVSAVTSGEGPVGSLIQKGRDWVGGFWNNSVNANTSGEGLVGNLIQKGRDWVGGLWGNTVTAQTQGQSDVESLSGQANDFRIGNFLNQVVADVRGRPEVDGLRGAVDMLSPKSVTAAASAVGQGAVSTLRGTVGSLFSKYVNASASASGQGPVSSLRNTVGSLFNKTVFGRANAQGQGPVTSLRNAVSGLFNKTVTGRANAVGEGANRSLRSAVASLFSKTVTGRANSQGEGMVKSLRASVAALFNKTVAARANSYGKGSVDSLTGSIRAVFNKTVRVGANTFGSWAIQSLKNMISSVRGKTVDVITRVRKVFGNADGSFTPAGTRRFARGAFMAAGSNINRYAYGAIIRGGSGRHAPQIRYPQGPNQTIWAEGSGKGSTAGESYIPHAIGKRSRSTQILSQTAREFGLGVVKYNDGGVTHIGGASPAQMLQSAPVGDGINYRKMAQAMYSAQDGMSVRIANSSDLRARRSRR